MPTPFTGPDGEHYVLYRLLRRHYVAGLAPERAPNVDILAASSDGTRTVTIQVKTRQPIGRDNGWHMKDKHELIVGEKVFYCMVDLKKDESASPDIYILPSRLVADVIKETHQIWLRQPGKGGQAHNPTKMRRLLPDYGRTLKLTPDQHKKYGEGWLERYRENWSILGLD